MSLRDRLTRGQAPAQPPAVPPLPQVPPQSPKAAATQVGVPHTPLPSGPSTGQAASPAGMANGLPKKPPQPPLPPLQQTSRPQAAPQAARRTAAPAEVGGRAGGRAGAALGANFHELRTQIHAQLVAQIDLTALERLSPEEQAAELRRMVASLIEGANLPLNRMERERLTQEVIHEVTGFGPLEPLLADPSISDILVNGPHTIYVERGGMLSRTDVVFKDNGHLMRIINRIVGRIGRRVDEMSPMCDARLPDGSRVNVIIPPLALDGATMSIRRFGGKPLEPQDLVRKGAMTADMLEFISAAVRARMNVVVSGGTGTGKTTLLNALSSFIPAEERVVTIEDAAELQLQQPHVVRLETRPPNVEGQGEVRARQLVINSLRMRPDRIVVGEIRGAEVLDMLQAMNTGHDGSMTTVHANNTRDALGRLLMMAGMSEARFSETLLNQSISRAVNIIVQLRRFSDGSRRVINITEVTGMEGDVITTQDIFAYRQRGKDEHNRVIGDFQATGVRPRCMEQIAATGYQYQGRF